MFGRPEALVLNLKIPYLDNCHCRTGWCCVYVCMYAPGGEGEGEGEEEATDTVQARMIAFSCAALPAGERPHVFCTGDRSALSRLRDIPEG